MKRYRIGVKSIKALNDVHVYAKMSENVNGEYVLYSDVQDLETLKNASEKLRDVLPLIEDNIGLYPSNIGVTIEQFYSALSLFEETK